MSGTMLDFVNCQGEIDVTDHPFSGNLFTWCNHREEDPLSRKLDRVLVPVLGNPLQVLFAKLKRLKEPLKKFNKEKFGGISNKVLQKRVEYENIQNSLLVSPTDLILQERVVRSELRNLERAEEMFYL
ncbi:hypothetical protein V6N13_077066 [Hibiscus sabdariffa]